MLSSRTFWQGRSFPLFDTEDTGGGTNDDGNKGDTGRDAGNADDQQKTGDGEKGDDKEALRRMGEQRDAARKDAADMKKRLDAIEDAEKKRRDKEAKEAGKFEELANEKDAELKTATGRVADLEKQVEALTAAIDAVLDSEWKQLPEEVRDAYLGDDDDPLAKLKFLPRGKKLAEKLTEKNETGTGNRQGPNSTGVKGRLPTKEQLADEFRRASGLPVQTRS